MPSWRSKNKKKEKLVDYKYNDQRSYGIGAVNSDASTSMGGGWRGAPSASLSHAGSYVSSSSYAPPKVKRFSHYTSNDRFHRNDSHDDPVMSADETTLNEVLSTDVETLDTFQTDGGDTRDYTDDDTFKSPRTHEEDDDDEEDDDRRRRRQSSSGRRSRMEIDSSAGGGGVGGRRGSRRIKSQPRQPQLEDIESLMDDTRGDYYYVKQKYGFLSIALSSLQLLVLMLQLALCGVAPLDVNPMVGPYPDTISEWGGKNAYLIIKEYQYWRFLSPMMLHTGVLHLLCNVAIQLETAAFFEREWGSLNWLIIYTMSATGAMVLSTAANPDGIVVGSSGAIMGLFGAKFSQVCLYGFFETQRRVMAEETLGLEQLSGALCSAAIVSFFSFIPYVDWSGHMGGFCSGALTGMMIFSKPLVSACAATFSSLGGFVGILVGYGGCMWYILTQVEPDEELADACEYFRNMYVEGYDCQCLW